MLAPVSNGASPLPTETLEVLVRRIAFYLFYDPQGQVDEYVTHALAHLRPHVEHVFVVSNVALDDTARAALEAVADQVWERANG